jgi:hypothetical protein
VAGRVQQGKRRAGMCDMRLRGEHGDAPAALDLVGVQRGSPRSPGPVFQFSARICMASQSVVLPASHVRQDADRRFFMVSPFQVSRRGRPSTNSLCRFPPDKKNRAAKFSRSWVWGTMMHFLSDNCRRKGAELHEKRLLPLLLALLRSFLTLCPRRRPRRRRLSSIPRPFAFLKAASGFSATGQRGAGGWYTSATLHLQPCATRTASPSLRRGPDAREAGSVRRAVQRFSGRLRRGMTLQQYDALWP